MPLPTGSWGTLMSYNEASARFMYEEVPFILSQPVRRDELSDPDRFSVLELSKRLGVPLVFKAAAFSMLMPGEQDNETAALLSITCDTTKPQLQVTMNCDIICTADGHDLEPDNLKPILDFVKTELGDVVAYGTGKVKGEEAEKKAREAWKKATPREFKKFYEEFNSKPDTRIVRPVEREKSLFEVEPICKTCGKQGEGLLLCATCKTVSYCSKDCQRKEWKLHKSVYHTS